jgi:hypothetical protein
MRLAAPIVEPHSKRVNHGAIFRCLSFLLTALLSERAAFDSADPLPLEGLVGAWCDRLLNLAPE